MRHEQWEHALSWNAMLQCSWAMVSDVQCRFIKNPKLTSNSGTDQGACAKESGCLPNFGVCWPDGQSSFLPISEVFSSATVSSSCPTGILPSLPIAGPLIAGATVQTSGIPPAEESSSTGIVVLPPGQTTPGPGSQTGLPLVPLPVPLTGPPGIPRLCGASGINLAPFA